MSPIWRRRTEADAETAVIGEPGATEEIIEEELPPGPPPPRIWPWLLALLLLVVGGGIAWWLLTREDDKTTMPNVIGLREAQARARIAESELEADVDRRASRRTRGIVFAQVPGAGTQLDEGERVEILVSSGLIRVVVPEVVGEREDPAVRALQSAGFEVDVQRVFAGAPRGEVVEQDPVGGSRAPRGSSVLVKVSRGRRTQPPEQATVPDVVGLAQTPALRRLRDAGLEGIVRYQSSDEPLSRVIAQRPAAGTRLPRGGEVVVTVSDGRATERVTVPDVVGTDEESARETLEAEGFRVEIIRVPTDDSAPGTVLDQQPAPDTRAPRGAVVTLYVAAAG